MSVPLFKFLEKDCFVWWKVEYLTKVFVMERNHYALTI